MLCCSVHEPNPQALTQPRYTLVNPRFDLHVLLVTHGKVCPTCKKGGGGGGKPAGAPCPLAAIIRQGRATHPAASPVEEAEQKRTIPTPLSDAIDAVTGPGAATGEGQSEKPVAAKSRAGSSGGDGGGDDGVRSVKRQRKAGQGEAVAAAAVAAVAEAAGDGVGVKAEPVEGELLPLGQVGLFAFPLTAGLLEPAVTKGC